MSAQYIIIINNLMTSLANVSFVVLSWLGGAKSNFVQLCPRLTWFSRIGQNFVGQNWTNLDKIGHIHQRKYTTFYKKRYISGNCFCSSL